MQQIIVSIGREFGSGGLEIAEKLAANLGLPLYDRNLLEKIAEERIETTEKFETYDEHCSKEQCPQHGHRITVSKEEKLAHFEFEYMRERARNKESFVVVGHCAEKILKDYSGLISIFVHADQDFKSKRVMEREHVSEEEAIALMKRTDSQRRAYHDRFCENHWGESSSYELNVNSGWLGIDRTVGMLERYILNRKKEMEAAQVQF